MLINIIVAKLRTSPCMYLRFGGDENVRESRFPGFGPVVDYAQSTYMTGEA